MKQRAVTAWAMVGAAAAWVSAAGAWAAPALLPARAFQAPDSCTLEPFVDASAEQRERQMARDCGRDRLQMRLATPRVRALDPGPSRVELEVDQLVTLRADDVTASARLGWAGSSQEDRRGVQTDRALIAAGGLWRLDRQFALAMKVGSDLGTAVRTRATLSGLYRHAERDLLFMQVSAEETGLTPAVGLRWWLAPRASFDFVARRGPGSAVEPSLVLQVLGFGR